MWYEKIIAGLTGPQVVNDSKTPSGRVHVGALRGVLIHDAIYRALRDQGGEAKYLFGVDDFDPLDGLPADADPQLQEFMGYPLCHIPAPPGSPAPDLAEHYIREFLGVFDELGVGADIYRMREVYRSGRFNEAIDAILSRADIVRRIYAEVSNAVRSEDWLPFQVVCENCGRIGTTAVTDYDGREVSYHCRRDLVSWAVGCGHRGRTSPFDGRGKLPWKLEWVAKWRTFGVTIEGAGKDHCTKGGSRDVAARCFEAIFGQRPPLNVPYEFFLASGAKMSSSKGVGTAARDIADFLPPELVRFLMIRTPPKKTVNFSTDFDYVVKLFNEHDRLLEASLAGQATPAQEAMRRAIAIAAEAPRYRPVSFQLVTALLQLPHIEVETAVEKRTPGGLTAADREHLRQRIAAARYWLEHYATAADRIALQETLPASAATLSATQKAFLRRLGDRFPAAELGEEDYQKFIFDTARLTPIDQPAAFAAIYRVLLDKEQGPKGGSLFAYLDKAFLVQRFRELTYSTDSFWRETAISPEEGERWLASQRDQLTRLSAVMRLNAVMPAAPGAVVSGQGVIELMVTLTDGKTHQRRMLLTRFEGERVDLEAEARNLESQGNACLDGFSEKLGMAVERPGKPVVTTESAASL